jgi:hypothetical protein
MPIDTATNLAHVFYETVQKHASDRGYQFWNSQRLQQLADQGANVIFQRIAANNVHPYNPNILRIIREAEDNSKRFVDGMIINHRGRPNAQGGVLEDVDFQFSSLRHSPIYPFCGT